MKGMQILKQAIIREVETLTKGRIVAYGTNGVGVTLAADTGVYVSLLTCDDDPNYDTVSDGTNIAECEPGSKITSIDIQLIYKGATAVMHEAMLFRDRDGEISTITPLTGLYAADSYSELIASARANILSYKGIYLTSTSDAKIGFLRISRAALARTRTMHDGDIMKLYLFNEGGTTANFWLFGNINHRI